MRVFTVIVLLLSVLVAAAFADGMHECEKEEDCFHMIGPCTDVKCGRGGHCQAFTSECPCPEDVTDNVFHVHELTDETFEDAIQSGGVWFINFYGPWCGWCKKLMPTWDNLASLVRERWNVGQVDCKEYPALCHKYIAEEGTGKMGYPTLDLFVDGEFVDRYGVKERDFGRLIRWVEAKADVERTCLPKRWEPKIVSDEPASERDGNVVVVSDENSQATFAEGDWFVKFYAPWCGHCKRMADAWRSLAEEHPHYNVAEVDCTEHVDTAGRYNVRGYPTIYLLRDGKIHERFSGDRTVDSFVSFLGKHADVDLCPDDPDKRDPGVCGCGLADIDSDNDGVPDCNDGCPNDPDKTEDGCVVAIIEEQEEHQHTHEEL